jgi:predicted MFS family arabinose efflux permease
LKILAQQTGTTFTGISSILAARGAGYMTGNILGAVMQNMVKRFPEGLLALAFLIASVGQ